MEESKKVMLLSKIIPVQYNKLVHNVYSKNCTKIKDNKYLMYDA